MLSNALRRVGVLLVAGLGTAVPVSGQEQSPVTAFVNVAVIPMDRERVLPDQTVIVRGERIVALGAAARVRVPAGARRIDGRGKYLLPGLADMHAHVPTERAYGAMARGDTLAGRDRRDAEQMLFLHVANGVTTVRILYGSKALLALRAQVVAGQLLGPRMYVATPSIGGGRAMIDGVQLDSAVKIPVVAKRSGYDLIKLYGVDGKDLDSLGAAARRVGIPFAGHVPGNGSEGTKETGLDGALRAGYASIEHLSGFVNGYGGGGLFFDLAQLPAKAAAMRQAGVWSCPTLMNLGFNTGYFTPDSAAAWPEIRYLSDSVRPIFTGPRPNLPPVDSALHWMAVRRQVVKTLRDAGAGLLLGTDTPAGAPVPGFSVHRELVELVKAGLTPYEALATGTRNVAAYFGTLDSAGTVAVGKRADLILLTGNPLTDIRQTTRRAGVMVGGRWLPQADLERRLAALEGKLY